MIYYFNQYYQSYWGLKSLIGEEQLRLAHLNATSSRYALEKKYGPIGIKFSEYNTLFKEIASLVKAGGKKEYENLLLKYNEYKDCSKEDLQVLLTDNLKTCKILCAHNTSDSIENAKEVLGEICVLLDCLINSDTEIKEYTYGYLFADIKNNVIDMLKLKDELDIFDDLNNLDNIKEEYYELSIEELISNHSVIRRFNSMNIYTIQDLVKMDKIIIAIVLEDSFNSFSSIVGKITKGSCMSNLSIFVDLMQLQFDIEGKGKDWFNIFARRNGIKTGKKETLEQIGADYKLTRERIRQIESKVNKVIINNCDGVIRDFDFYVIGLIGLDALYVDESIIRDKLKEDTDFIIAILNIMHKKYQYSEDYHIFYKADCLESILSSIDLTKKYFFIKDYESKNMFEKSIVDNHYKLRHGIYIRRDVNNVQLLNEVIDELFPNGYKASNEESFKKLQETFYKKYGFNLDSTMHAVASNLVRYNYCLVDRGTYLNRDLVPSLDEEFLYEIINYLEEHAPVITYNAIFERFNDEFKTLGINNVYYAKGIIDYKLPKEYSTAKDYITLGAKTNTYREVFVNYVNTLHGVFSMDDLLVKFPGNKPYVINSIIMSMDNILFFENSNYIRIEDLDINEDIVNALKKEIDDLFNAQKLDCITTRKLYAKMKIMKSDVLKELDVINNQFRLFSLLQHMFKGQYEFRRPYIGVLGKKNISKYLLVKDYLYRLDQFSVKTIASYVNKLNITGLYSTMELFIDMSVDYVQYNKDSMIRKDKILLSDNALNQIKNEIEFYINSFGNIDTRIYRGYGLYPLFGYVWNKYLLAGIVRTFFSDAYDIELTDSAYDLTDFIIRRAK